MPNLYLQNIKTVYNNFLYMNNTYITIIILFFYNAIYIYILHIKAIS